MNKREFIESYLTNYGIPTKSKTNKCIVTLIEKGYRASGLSSGGANNFTKKWFPDKPRNESIFIHILLKSNISYCNSCDNLLELEAFPSNISSKTKTQSMCRSCWSIYRTEKVNQSYYAAKRKSAKLQAIPKWADLNKIKEIYKNCPEGYHVDHIFPLRGENSCGLHVENNLQYLTAEENMRKGNKLPV